VYVPEPLVLIVVVGSALMLRQSVGLLAGVFARLLSVSEM
jgi:hypothetical protein